MKPISFLHLIKTGGSTICAHLSKHLSGYLDLDLPALSSIGKLRFRSGHALRFHPEFRNMTILRDPADWLVSIYHHDLSRRKQEISFEEWYDRGGIDSIDRVGARRNRMVAWCAQMFILSGGLKELKEMLSACWLVGTTESLDLDLPYLFRYLGVPEKFKRERVAGAHDRFDNLVIKKTFELDLDMRTKLYEENPEDLDLYLYARKLALPWKEKLWT